MKTKGKLKNYYSIINHVASGWEKSPAGASIKIYHSDYADVEHNPDMARDHNRSVSGSVRGYICVHGDYCPSMFGQWVTIGPKYNRDGSLNTHQCIVYGNRNPDHKAFNAYYEWFEDITPIEHCNMGINRHARQSGQPQRQRQTTVDVTRQTWDQLFEV